MSDIYTSGDVQAGYWLGSITRKEAQGVYDEFANAIGATQGTVMKLDAAIAFLFEKFGISPEEVSAWLTKKAAESEAASASAQPSPIVT
jgi:hypothetical protein